MITESIIKNIQKMKTMDSNPRLLQKVFNDISSIIFDDERVMELLELKKDLSSDKESILEWIMETVSATVPINGKGMVTSLYTMNVFLEPGKVVDMSTIQVNQINIKKILSKHKIDLKNTKDIFLAPFLLPTEVYDFSYAGVANMMFELTEDELSDPFDPPTENPLMMVLPVIVVEDQSSSLERQLHNLKFFADEPTFVELSGAIFGKGSGVQVVNFLPYYDSLMFSKTSEFSSMIQQVLNVEQTSKVQITDVVLNEEDGVVSCEFFQKEELISQVSMALDGLRQREFLIADMQGALTDLFGFKQIEVGKDNSIRFQSVRHLH
jgi:hypothetical protein